jgi:hypothetical protein
LFAAVLAVAAWVQTEAQVMNNGEIQLRLRAFMEQPALGKAGPTVLQIYIVNESLAALDILNDIDSINMPPRVPQAGEVIQDSDFIHVDFGVSGVGRFVPVPPGEAVKITLLLNDEQAKLLAQVRQIKAAVKFRQGTAPANAAQSLLLLATVHKTNPP